MYRSTVAARRLLLLATLATAATVSACSDSSISAPLVETRKLDAPISLDDDPGNPPVAPCRSGWAVINGRWECGDT